MSQNNKTEKYGVHDTVNGLHTSLQQYIEAQYHIKDDGLVSERNALLKTSTVIAQKAFIEATPVYEQGACYEKLNIPNEAKDVLTAISNLGGNEGLYPTPYMHQAQALEEFFGLARKDLVVATGTGSGKTESFLMPIIGTLAIESAQKPNSNNLPGCRALLLYPMNALVNDQMARIRRLLGSVVVNNLVSKGRNRTIKFGAYTGRTTYPGARTSVKDKANIIPLFDEFYSKVETQPELKTELQAMGRWPSKDLPAFSNENASTVRGGWANRFQTQVGDRELMTRHEMQKECPDLLVTNYSMLEFMLMRPIENEIFKQTEAWLKSDASNELILVLDEAHMYRGAGGAEVALLIRRLIARLGVSREKIRCILTSASLGTDATAIEDITQFANDLTGLSKRSSRTFKIITGKKEVRAEGKSANYVELTALAAFDVDKFSNIKLDLQQAIQEVNSLAHRLGWTKFDSSTDDVSDYLYQRMSGFGPAELLISKVSGQATSLDELVSLIFLNIDNQLARNALDALLSICTHARRKIDGRVLIPTRLHLFHRGLPGLHACIDNDCSDRKALPTGQTILGRFHTKPRQSCSCDSNSRVFEFLTHRDCGAAFVKGWVDDSLTFVWHEPDALSATDHNRKLYPIEMLVEKEVHSSARCRDMWLHLATGQLRSVAPTNLAGFRLVRIPDKQLTASKELTFDVCPVCIKKTKQTAGDQSKIMDHVTKGEAPFATLVRAQMAHQPPIQEVSTKYPNAGKKVLVFSDGRQKAARLARDMPRDMELDVFRQAIALATVALNDLGRECKPTDALLYLSFIATLAKQNVSMFDVDADIIDGHIATFLRDCQDLEGAFEETHSTGASPSRYKVALLKLLCSNYYSLSGTTIGFVEPAKKVSARLMESCQAAGIEISGEDLKALSIAWIDEMLSGFAFDADIPVHNRERACGFPKPQWGMPGKFDKMFRQALLGKLKFSDSKIEKIEGIFREILATEKGGYFLSPNSVKLSIDLNHQWTQCQTCTSLMSVNFRNHCVSCGSADIKILDPLTAPYLKARKSFWRTPVSNVIVDDAKLSNLYVEEHTAQLSNRDRKAVHSTTELHELRFQNILLDKKDRPIDVLSCTTTMEVGIDIGSLVAVALRNVPPQRENYQQRAGRAGRRGASVSSVVTFSQNGPHDSHYFLNPKPMVSGAPRTPEVKTDNPKIARRHVHAFLIQSFFQDASIDSKGGDKTSSALHKALGKTVDFFTKEESSKPNLSAFISWIDKNVLSAPYRLREIIATWLPENLNLGALSKEVYISNVAQELSAYLITLQNKVASSDAMLDESTETDEGDVKDVLEQKDLLEFLFFYGVLPTYAFPTSLCSFLVEKIVKNQKNYSEIRIEQMPQQSTAQALSEYAPGRLIVINKKAYRSGGVFSNAPATEVNRSQKLFSEKKKLVMCEACSFVQDPRETEKAKPLNCCPVCSGMLKSEYMIQPEVFGPAEARAVSDDDHEQEITYATMAQFPQPTNGELFEFRKDGFANLEFTYSTNKRLLTLNKGLSINGESAGFSVCSSCGSAEPHDGKTFKSGRHTRPYKIRSTEQCNGNFEKVVLGYDFATDLLLLRLTINKPLITDIGSRGVVRTIESAAYTLAEALRLAASRHQQLDLDPTEFGAGHRLLQPNSNGALILDVYLYDTLSGGAGYAELAAKYFGEIIKDTLKILEDCNCDTSCTECLDHFHNQHLKRQLDRNLAASLLRYGLYGTIPAPASPEIEIKTLKALCASLELDGFDCKMNATELAPLVATRDKKLIGIKTYPTLLDINGLAELLGIPKQVFLVSESRLRVDLPGVHAAAKAGLN